MLLENPRRAVKLQHQTNTLPALKPIPKNRARNPCTSRAAAAAAAAATTQIASLWWR